MEPADLDLHCFVRGYRDLKTNIWCYFIFESVYITLKEYTFQCNNLNIYIKEWHYNNDFVFIHISWGN